MGAVRGDPKHQWSLTTNRHNRCNNNEKVWNIARITKMWHRDTQWAHAAGKMAPIDLLDPGLPQNLQYVKKKNATSAKYSKTRYACQILLNPQSSFGDETCAQANGYSAHYELILHTLFIPSTIARWRFRRVHTCIPHYANKLGTYSRDRIRNLVWTQIFTWAQWASQGLHDRITSLLVLPVYHTLVTWCASRPEYNSKVYSSCAQISLYGAKGRR
jgi:hypothetical protein